MDIDVAVCVVLVLKNRDACLKLKLLMKQWLTWNPYTLYLCLATKTTDVLQRLGMKMAQLQYARLDASTELVVGGVRDGCLHFSQTGGG